MPIKKKISEMLFSKEVTAPKGQKTLGIFARDKNNNKIRFVEYRACEKINNKWKCPRKSTEPTKRRKLALKLGIK